MNLVQPSDSRLPAPSGGRPAGRLSEPRIHRWASGTAVAAPPLPEKVRRRACQGGEGWEVTIYGRAAILVQRARRYRCAGSCPVSDASNVIILFKYRLSWKLAFHCFHVHTYAIIRQSSQSHTPSPYLRTAMRSKHSNNGYLFQHVAVDIVLELELLTLALATGIMDATTFPDYHVFASNQTGNTAILAVGALGIGGDLVNLKNAGVSLGCFVGGGILFGQIGNLAGPRRRAWLLASNWTQTALIFAATALQRFASSTSASVAMGIVALLAFASGGQVALARTVEVPEITTAMVTSAYIDVAVGAWPVKLDDRPRNRRILFILNLLLGSFIGAVAYRYVGPSLAFLLAAVVKMGVSAALFFNKAAPSGEHKPGNESTV